MKLSTLILCAVTLFMAGPAIAQSDRDDEDAILSMLREGALNIGRDTARWEANFHPDWTVWFAGNDTQREREPHMQAVRDYVARGAVVEQFELQPVSLDVFGDQALIRYHAIEHVRDPENGLRVIHYAATALLLKEDGRWLIRASSLSFPSGYTPPAEE